MKEAVGVLKSNPALRIEISGHTSSEGRETHNMDLSRRRAESVKRYIVSEGVGEARIKTMGYGPKKPIEDNVTRVGRRANRRIEFRLLGRQE